MKITLIERTVKRCENPSCSDYKKIINAYGTIIDTYMSNVIPRVGEILLIDSSIAYDIIDVIYKKVPSDSQSKGMGEIGEVIIEISRHNNKTSFNVGSYLLEEDHPLITDLECSWIPQDLQI